MIESHFHSPAFLLSLSLSLLNTPWLLSHSICNSLLSALFSFELPHVVRLFRTQSLLVITVKLNNEKISSLCNCLVQSKSGRRLKLFVVCTPVFSYEHKRWSGQLFCMERTSSISDLRNHIVVMSKSTASDPQSRKRKPLTLWSFQHNPLLHYTVNRVYLFLNIWWWEMFLMVFLIKCTQTMSSVKSPELRKSCS